MGGSNYNFQFDYRKLFQALQDHANTFWDGKTTNKKIKVLVPFFFFHGHKLTIVDRENQYCLDNTNTKILKHLDG